MLHLIIPILLLKYYFVYIYILTYRLHELKAHYADMKKNGHYATILQHGLKRLMKRVRIWYKYHNQLSKYNIYILEKSILYASQYICDNYIEDSIVEELVYDVYNKLVYTPHIIEYLSVSRHMLSLPLVHVDEQERILLAELQYQQLVKARVDGCIADLESSGVDIGGVAHGTGGGGGGGAGVISIGEGRGALQSGA